MRQQGSADYPRSQNTSVWYRDLTGFPLFALWRLYHAIINYFFLFNITHFPFSSFIITLPDDFASDFSILL